MTRRTSTVIVVLALAAAGCHAPAAAGRSPLPEKPLGVPGAPGTSRVDLEHTVSTMRSRLQKNPDEGAAAVRHHQVGVIQIFGVGVEADVLHVDGLVMIGGVVGVDVRVGGIPALLRHVHPALQLNRNGSAACGEIQRPATQLVLRAARRFNQSLARRHRHGK